MNIQSDKNKIENKTQGTCLSCGEPFSTYYQFCPKCASADISYAHPESSDKRHFQAASRKCPPLLGIFGALFPFFGLAFGLLIISPNDAWGLGNAVILIIVICASFLIGGTLSVTYAIFGDKYKTISALIAVVYLLLFALLAAVIFYN